MIRAGEPAPPVQAGRGPYVAVAVAALAALAAKVALAATANDGGHFADAAAVVGRLGVTGSYAAAEPFGYPPLAAWILWALNGLAGVSVVSVDFLVHAVAIVADLITALLVFAIVRRFRSAVTAAASAVVVSLSPVLLAVSGLYGSFVPLAVVLALLGVWLLISGRSALLAGVSVAAAVGVSLTAAVVLPVLLLVAVRGGARRAAAHATGLILVGAALWLPVVLSDPGAYWADATAAVTAQRWGLVQLAGAGWGESLSGPGRFVAGAVAALVPLVVAWRRPTESARAAGLALVLVPLLSSASGMGALAWAAVAALVVSFWLGLAFAASAGALVVTLGTSANPGAAPWQWAVAEPTTWEGSPAWLATVAWLSLLGVAVVGLVPLRSVAPAGTGAARLATGPGQAPGVGGAASPLQTSQGRPPRIGILVVTYNAAAKLTQTLDRIPHDFRSRISEIIMLDDASKDDTVLHGQAWARRPDSPKMTVIRHTKNLGYGGNQKAGYALAIESGLDIIVLLHGDGQYAPELLPEMVAPIERGEADAVFGSRMLIKGGALRGRMPLYKFVGNKILTAIENRLLGTRLSEFHSGYRAYSVAALRELPLEHNTDEFHFDTQIIVQLVHAGKRILEIPIPTYYGDEISHVNGMRYAWDVVKDVIEYRLAVKGFGTTAWIPKPEEYAFKEGDGSSHSIMLDMLKDAKPSRVLDIGCSGGLLAEHIRARGHHVVGVDYLEVPGVRDRVDAFHQADLNHPLPAEVGSGYDVVIAGDIIEHLMVPGAALKQMRRVLRPGGQVLLSVPNFGHWYPRFRTTFGLFGYDRRGILDDTHLRFFTRRTLRRLVRSHGFDILEERATGLPLGTISEADGVRLRLMRAVDRALVRMRPTLFGYQFVLRLIPHAEEAVVVERA